MKREMCQIPPLIMKLRFNLKAKLDFKGAIAKENDLPLHYYFQYFSYIKF